MVSYHLDCASVAAAASVARLTSQGEKKGVTTHIFDHQINRKTSSSWLWYDELCFFGFWTPTSTTRLHRSFCLFGWLVSERPSQQLGYIAVFVCLVGWFLNVNVNNWATSRFLFVCLFGFWTSTSTTRLHRGFLFVWLVGFWTSKSTTRLHRGFCLFGWLVSERPSQQLGYIAVFVCLVGWFLNVQVNN